MNPAAVRAIRMPSSNPLIRVPTTRPRCDGSLRPAAMGTSTWATTENRPVRVVPISSHARFGENALISRPRVLMAIMLTISLRCSNRSPSGASSNRPAP
ncbi:hypothetical protein D3C84_916410 [compost metagenome]